MRFHARLLLLLGVTAVVLGLSAVFAMPVSADFDNPGFELCTYDQDIPTPIDWDGDGECVTSIGGRSAVDVSDGKYVCQSQTVSPFGTYQVTVKVWGTISITVDSVFSSSLTGTEFEELTLDIVPRDSSTYVCFVGDGFAHIDDTSIALTVPPTVTVTPAPTPTIPPDDFDTYTIRREIDYGQGATVLVLLFNSGLLLLDVFVRIAERITDR